MNAKRKVGLLFSVPPFSLPVPVQDDARTLDHLQSIKSSSPNL
jgi:hypothetical protein